MRLPFDDGTVGDVDLSTAVWSGVLEPLRDRAFFSQGRVDPEATTVAGRTVWTWVRSRCTSRRFYIRWSPPDFELQWAPACDSGCPRSAIASLQWPHLDNAMCDCTGALGRKAERLFESLGLDDREPGDR